MNWRWVEVGVQTEKHEPGKTMSSRQNVALRSCRSAGAHDGVFSHENRFKVAMKNCNCDIWITKCTQVREKTSPSLRFSNSRAGRRSMARILTCWLIFHLRFSVTKVCGFLAEGHVAPPTPPPPPNHELKVKEFILQFCCGIWEMRHWKTPPDRHLNCAIQITLRDANLPTHWPKYHH